MRRLLRTENRHVVGRLDGDGLAKVALGLLVICVLLLSNT